MKTRRLTLVGLIAAIIGISTFFIGCDNDVNGIVIYRGQVVYINTTTPFADLTVKVTDGINTHCQTQTNAEGMFSLKVRVDEIDGGYYLLVGDSTCIPKKVALGGYGQAEVDLGVIEVEGPALPTVITTPLQSVTAEEAILGGEVQTNGRMSVTARGVCYGTEPYPTIEGLHTTDGMGLGTFTSTLKNLEYNTIYYARAYATNKKGTAYGDQVKFTTEEGVAIVITDTIINITAHSAKCKGNVESDGGFPVVKRGTCWSKRPDPTIDDDCTDDGSGKGEFTSTMKNLEENTTYYVRTYATNSTATSYGEQVTITTLDGLAEVKTDSVTAVTATGFTVYGTVVSDCDIPVSVRGFCYATTQYPTIEDAHTTSGKGLGDFKSNITKLDYATTYYVRAYATNETGTVYGKEIEIKTLTGLPKVTTDSVSNIGSVKATCGGNVTDDGTLTVTARGVCYGTEPQPTIEDTHTIDGKGTGKFVSNLKNLQDKTTYYVRAYATTAAGTAYGEQRKFKTEDGTPVVLLKEVGEPTANSVTCKGNVTGDGGVTITERGFCYGLTQYPTNTDTHIAIGNGVGEFSGSLTKLTVNTTYYIRAYAVNSLGVGYSEQKSFVTKSGLPIVTTAADPKATATTIKVGGNVTDNGGYAVTDRGVCYSTSNSEPTITEDKVSGGKGNGEFSVTITGLSANTIYHLRAYATNENGTVYGESVSIQTGDGSASVTLGTITYVTATTASASVKVTNVGSAALQSCGICWATNPNPTIEDSKVVADGKQLNTAYTCNMSGLIANQKYYVRAYATTDATTTYSDQQTFTTQDGLASISTGTITTTSNSITCAGEVTDDSGYSVTERGICYSTSNSEPTITDGKISGGSGKGTFSVTISKLTPATLYYVRAYATNKNGTNYGNVVSANTKNGAATVNITAVSDITALTASSQVTVTDAGGATLQSCGLCWATIPNPTIADSKIEAGGKSLNTAYSCNMTNLTPKTTYYVRGYAKTDINITYSAQQTFVTKAGIPIVSTGTTTATTTTITCAGEVSDNGGYAVTERGICYSMTNSEPTILDSKQTSGSGNGTFNVTISKLTPTTKYYVRAYATNINGTGYGETVLVTTKNGEAVVTTGQVTNIKALTATGSVTVSSAGGTTLQSSGICWATSPNPTKENSKALGGTQINTEYKCNMSALTPNTTYYVRAYAVTDMSTTYGKEVSFKTTTGLPIITLSTQILTKSLVLNASISDDGGYPVTERGICWSATNGNPTIADTHTESGTGTGNYSVTIGNLEPSTMYYVRAYAKNEIGLVYSDVQAKTTGNGLQGVHFDTDPISNIKGGSATCKVIVDYRYSDVPIINEGVCWSSTTTTPTIDDSKTSEGKSTTSFTSTLTNLTPLTTYYVRAYITTSYGTNYSSNYVSFTTTSGLPTVVTNEITTSGVTNNSFVCGGEVTDIGDAPVTARGICWNTTGTPTLSDTHSSSGSGLGSFTHTVTGVSTTSQTYYIRAYATNKYGTSYGEVIVQNKNNPYHLPVYEINGVYYMIYPQDFGEMTWTKANSTCESLTAYGFSDWRLMTREEAKILKNSNARKVFTPDVYYWTSTLYYSNSTCCYYVMRMNLSGNYTAYEKSGERDSANDLNNVRPIRVMIQ